MLLKIFKRLTRILLCTLMSAWILPAQAFTVLDAWGLALQNDPQIQAALKEKQAGDEDENISRAGLLPSIRVEYRNAPHNRQKSTWPASDFYTGESSKATSSTRYDSYSGSVTLTQPLFDYAAYSRYQIGKAQTLMSNQQYRSKVQDLALRVINAYIAVASAKEHSILNNEQEIAYSAQLIANRQLMAAGEGTITDIAETQALLSLSQAQKIEAQDELDFAERELEAIIGYPLSDMSAIKLVKPGPAASLPLSVSDLAELRKTAIEKNPGLKAARYDMEATKKQIEVNRAKFLPKVELYATHSESDSSTDNTINQHYRTNSVGVQVSMDIFSSGGDSAALRQARARYGKSAFDLDSKTRSLLNDLRKQYNIYFSSQAKISAFHAAVISATEQLKATKKGVLSGQRVNLDILNARQLLFKAQKDLSDANYAFVKAYINLLADAGTLNQQDIVRVAEYFAISPSHPQGRGEGD